MEREELDEDWIQNRQESRYSSGSSYLEGVPSVES